MAIETTQNYQTKELRLQEIKNTLEAITKKEEIDLGKVVKLREEARIIASELKAYLKQTFETKN
jgi:hypothetical protein